MHRTFKCEYCESRPNTVHENEYLCNRHYNILYGNTLIQGEQIVDVPKTNEEKILKKHYMKILSNHNFVDNRKTKKIVKQFLKDAEYIKTTNSIYH